MVQEVTLQKYAQALLSGDRRASRAVIEEAMQSGVPANCVYMDLIWPVMVQIDSLHRADKITAVQEHLATRINRTIVDQLQNKLPRKPFRDKKIVIVSGPSESGELGAQMASDLFESDGWEVRFLGGGVTNDDILAFINEYSPEILLVYGATPKCAPEIRHLIDTVRNVNAWPNMKIMVSGGLFNRAEGLWEEIGADLFAESAQQALEIATGKETRTAQESQGKTINKRKRNLKRSKETVNA
jgi:methanogenic corrinoid protein MtbC1